jgi:tetratricopeptide (TPR) repeat protein
VSRTLAIALAAWIAALALASDGTERGEIVRAVRAELETAARALEASELDDATRLYGAALDRARSIPGADLLVARAADGLADAHRLSGRHREAEPLYEEAVRLWERALGPDQPRLATTLHNLGLTLAASGRPADAEPVLRRALAIWERVLGTGSAEAANTRRALETVTQRAEPTP